MPTEGIQRAYLPAPPDLRPWIDRIWCWEGPAGASLPTLLPGTGAEWVFHYATPFAAVAPDGSLSPAPLTFISCLRSRAVPLVTRGRVGLVSVRFRGSALRHFGRLPMVELADRFASAEETFGPRARELAQAIRQLPDLPARAAEIVHFLRTHLARHPPTDSHADRLLDALYYADCAQPVAGLAAQLGLSTRQLERTVGAVAGLSPKRFRRISRFHHVMRRLHLDAQPEYLDAALAFGFHDQAHFIHDCRDLTGHAPGQLLAPARLASHFYNTSLPRPG